MCFTLVPSGSACLVLKPIHDAPLRGAPSVSLFRPKKCMAVGERESEKLHYVHSASLAYEDGSVFMSGPFADRL